MKSVNLQQKSHILMVHYEFYVGINSKLCALLQKHKIERLEYGVGERDIYFDEMAEIIGNCWI